MTRLLGCALLALALLTGTAAAAAPTPPPVDVVPGVAFKATDGSVTFAGSGFAPLAPVQVSVNGTAHSVVTSNARGGFITTLDLKGVGSQSLAAAGARPDGRVHVVTASVQIGRTLPLLPAGTGSESTGARRVYTALGLGLGSVTVAVLALLLFRLARRQHRSAEA